MSLKNMVLLFILYGGPGIAALLFLLLGFLMARTRFEVIATGLLAGVLIAVQAAELYFLFGLRRALDGDSDDPLVLAGVAIVLLAAAVNALFVTRKLRSKVY
jgi:4-amino-4-deoxy-L-arabinose transferase-like glycosyltransferase